MKNIYIPLIGLFFTLTGISQPCLLSGIAFNTQAQIDSFQINYPGCTEIEGDVGVSGNDITNLDGLSVITSIGGHLIINFNPNLTNLSGLNNLNFIGGILQIIQNNGLTSLTGLNNLANVGIWLDIEGNSALTSMSGMEGLTYIGGSLSIVYNQSLTSLAGFSNLIYLGADLAINNNPALTSLMGLDGIGAGSIINLYIDGNIVLSVCAIQSICEYLANPNGFIGIHGNAIGCNNRAEVEAACKAISVENPLINDMFSIYPNPAAENLTIKSSVPGLLTIMNLNGQQILSRQIIEFITQIDISSLRSGVYIVRLTNDRTVQVGKFIKQ